jgi:spermidine/putrescine transport system permease protein
MFRFSLWLLVPALCWLGLFFVVPLLMMLLVSFASRGIYGGVEWTWTLANFGALLDPIYGRIYARSVVLAFTTTCLCAVLGFPLAWYMATSAPGKQRVWLLLVMIPFWTNFLVRSYAWMFILRADGLLNTALREIGLVTAPIELLYSDTAVLIGLVYGYLPFMVLPLYAALERIDRALLDAGRDLYASGWSVFRRIVLPLAKPGLVAGCILVFVPSLGAFITPDLLGGARSMMVGTLIQHEYLVVRDWPFGSAASLVLMAAVAGAAWWYLRHETGTWAGRSVPRAEGAQS